MLLPRCRSARTAFLSILLAFALSWCAARPAASQAANPEEEAARLDAYLRAAEQVRQFQGTVIVARKGVPVLERGYGYASLEFKVPNGPETKFLIGSITKQFTAALILRLQEQGRLSVDDPVTKYLPAYPADPWGRVTLHHLLTHPAGVPSYPDDEALMSRRGLDLTVAEIEETFRDKPLQFEPGSDWRYSNSGYFVLGLVIEAVAGTSYEQFLQDQILAPMRMHATGYAHNETILPNRACGYRGEGGSWQNAMHVSMRVPFSAGALYATAHDRLVWDVALGAEKVLRAGSKERMFTPVKQNYGYGWMIADQQGHRLIGHGGGIDGFTSHFARYPDDRVTIIVLCNNEAVEASSVGNDLAAIVFGWPYDLPVRKEPAAIDAARLDDYPGVYPLGDGQYRIIRRDGDGLTSQRSGGPLFRLFPEARDLFFYEHDHASTITFERDGAGMVVAHVMHQRGSDVRIERMTGPVADSLLALPPE